MGCSASLPQKPNTIITLVKLLLLCLLTFSTMRAQNSTNPYAQYGEVIVVQLPSAPFPHPLRAAGHTYDEKLYPAEQHYSDSSVAIFIPKNFKPGKKTDFVIHFHGWWNNIDTTLWRYRLIQQFAESGKNAIFVVPEGPRNAPDSFGGKLEDPGGFKRFMTDVVETLRKRSVIKSKAVGSVILSGHSGGYRVMSFILMRGGMPEHIKEVYLFDALYGQTEKYVYWLDHYKGKIVNIYTDSGGTKDESEKLMASLDGWKIPYLAKEDTAASANDLRKHRLIFLHTALEHDQVMHVRPNFLAYLKASCLADMKTTVKARK